MQALAEPTLAPMTPRPFRVVKRRRETADTWTLELEAGERAADRSRPGQFTMIYAFGIGEVPISVSRTDGCPARAHGARRRRGQQCDLRGAARHGARRARPVRETRGRLMRRTGKTS